jgi:cell division protein FtsA
MMDDRVVVGIDVGTTKICTLVAKEESPGQLRILGTGIENSQGLRKGVVVDLEASSRAIMHSIEKAERESGLEISSALVSLAGYKVSSVNNRGAVGVANGIVDKYDVIRAVDSARAIPFSHDQEVVQVIQRGFNLDGQEGIKSPIDMHAYRLEVETHIITASAASVENLRQCVEDTGIEISQFVLNPLAAAEEVLTETEREMGAIVCDIGGGTTDLAIFVDGNVWHTAVLPVGGNHITSDIAHGLRIPMSQAEEVKLQHGNALSSLTNPNQYFHIQMIGENEPQQVAMGDLVHIISARVEEIFSMVYQEIKRSGYDGLFPAGMVLTGGSSLLGGTSEVASKVLGLPVRIGLPGNILGMVDELSSPAYTTSVGLLRWALLMRELVGDPGRNGRHSLKPVQGFRFDWITVKKIFERMLP